MEVVDGFQRLTVLTILFCLLRDLDAVERAPPNARLLVAIRTRHDASARHRMSLRGQAEAFFHEHVRRPGASLAHTEQDGLSEPEQRILEVRDHLRGALMDYDAAQRRRLATFLLDQCLIVLMSSADIDGAYRIFMVLNATGKPLERNDILKADLLGKIPPGSSLLAQDAWDKEQHRLGKDFTDLFSHIRAMYGRPSDDVIAGIRAVVTASGGAEPFIGTVLQPAARTFDELRRAQHAGSHHSSEINLFLRYLGLISFNDWKPPTMLWWLEKGKDAGELLWFLKKLDRLALGIRLWGIGHGKRRTRFDALVTAIREGKDLKVPGSALDLSRPELRSIQHALRGLHTRNSPATKLLLMRLTDAMAGKAESLSFPKGMTVEHVLPKTLGPNSAWRDLFPDLTEREQCMESLGNLVLVTKPQNDRARNHEFGRKMEIYFKTVGAPTPAINEGLRGRTEWTAAQIKAREAELHNLIDRLWDFGLTSSRQDAAVQTPPAVGRKAARG
jgi:hypothetical protein